MSAEKTPPAKKSGGVSTHCVLCGHHMTNGDCGCPWHLPFEKWPAKLLSKLGDLVYGDPRAGS